MYLLFEFFFPSYILQESKSDTHSYISRYYMTETTLVKMYVGEVLSILHPDEWEVPSEVK